MFTCIQLDMDLDENLEAELVSQLRALVSTALNSQRRQPAEMPTASDSPSMVLIDSTERTIGYHKRTHYNI